MFATFTGVLNVVPPSVDFATKICRLVVSGHSANTSPFPLVVMLPPVDAPVVSAPLTFRGALHVPPGPLRTATKHGSLLCQSRYMLSRNGDDGLRSTHSVSRSAFVCGPDPVESNAHVAPPSGDLYTRMAFADMPSPMSAAHAVPSDVQLTAGSLWFTSSGWSLRIVCCHVAPPSVDKN